MLFLEQGGALLAYIWSPEKLESLLRHPSAEVQRWAIDKSFNLYPDALSDRVLALISSVDDNTARAILRRLAESKITIADIRPLIELTCGDAELELKALAGAILLRTGYLLLSRDLESASAALYPSIVGSTEHGFDLVLQEYRKYSGENSHILNGIARICNFDDLFRDLTNAERDKAIESRIDYFHRRWGGDSPPLKHPLLPEGLLSSLDGMLVTVAPRPSTPWKAGLLAELEHDKARIGAVTEIAREKAPSWSAEEKIFILACLVCLWRNEECGRRLANAEDVAGLWSGVVMKPWHGIPGQALKNFIASVKPEQILSSLSEALQDDYSYASYALSLLNAADTPGRFKLFLEVLEGKGYDDILTEEAADALRDAGIPATEFIMEQYPHMSQSLRMLSLYILDRLPTSRVVDFCLRHFDDYMSGSDAEDFVSCLEEIASLDFLVPVLREWREGEVAIGRAIKLISEIHGVGDEQIDRIILDTEKWSRRPEDILNKPISLFPLQCTECGRTYHYELKNIYVDKRGKPIIGEIIQCKGCGSIETYRETAGTHFGFMAEILRLEAARKSYPEQAPDYFETPLKLGGPVHMRALGRKVTSIGESYRIVKKQLEKHPTDPYLQKRMGNVFRNGGRPDLAIPHYLEAIRLNPKDAESLYCIADILIDQERYQEAIPYVERLVPLCRDSKMSESVRRDMFSGLLDQAHILKQKTGHKVELFRLAKVEEIDQVKEPITLDIRSFDTSKQEDFEWLYYVFLHGRPPKKPLKAGMAIEATRPEGVQPQSPVRTGIKTGRNAPCPCGSGLKYKKCCGR